MVLDVVSGIVGLVAFSEKLISLLNDLRGCGPKCTTLLQNMRNLRDVLQRVSSEYNKTLAAIDQLNGYSSSLSITDGLLSRCVTDCSTTCRDFEAVLTKISKSSVRAIKWKLAEGDLAHLASRMEANKSTLLLLLASMSEERERCHQHAMLHKPEPAKVERYVPPPPSYQSAVGKKPMPQSGEVEMRPNGTAGVVFGYAGGAVAAAALLSNPFGWVGLGVMGASAAIGGIVGSNLEK